jgi:MoaA/NifB/PqqE/SkfB family radical SAM enzyme
MRDEYQGPDMDLDMLERFFNEYKRFSKQTEHSLTGGEPTVFSDFDSLIQVFRDTGMTNYVVTNGQSESGVEAVIRNRDVVSLEGPNADINDRVRGSGSFQKTINAIRRYKEAGFEVDLRFVLQDENAPLLDEIFEVGQTLGVTHLRFSTLHPVGKAFDNELAASFPAMERARQRLKQLKKKYPHIRTGFNPRHMLPYKDPEWSESRCIPIRGPLNGITLLPDGKVSFCCDLFDLDFAHDRYHGGNDILCPIVGDYSTESLATIVQRKKMQIAELKRRRASDAKRGNLAGPREYICENCKYYFYHS